MFCMCNVAAVLRDTGTVGPAEPPPLRGEPEVGEVVRMEAGEVVGVGEPGVGETPTDSSPCSERCAAKQQHQQQQPQHKKKKQHQKKQQQQQQQQQQQKKLAKYCIHH